jgi:hypothetical protein
MTNALATAASTFFGKSQPERGTQPHLSTPRCLLDMAEDVISGHKYLNVVASASHEI